jgi:hypothetical protein
MKENEKQCILQLKKCISFSFSFFTGPWALHFKDDL